MQGNRWLTYCLWSLILGLSAASAWGQPRGLLTTKTEVIEVGRPFSFEMQVTHPSDMVIIFPDSSKGDIFPYELYRKEPIATLTDEESGTSTDRAIYEFYTWEIDSLQSLRLPFHYLVNGDTLTAYTNTLDFVFDSKIPEVTDSTKVQFIDGILPVSQPAPVARIMAWIAIIVGLLAGLAILLLKPIRNRVKKWSLKREWKKYESRLQEYRNKTSQKEEFLEGINAVWKDYFDRNYDFALRSMTTAELSELLNKNGELPDREMGVLVHSSKINDQYIYAGQDVDERELKEIYEEVADAMLKEYSRRMEASGG